MPASNDKGNTLKNQVLALDHFKYGEEFGERARWSRVQTALAETRFGSQHSMPNSQFPPGTYQHSYLHTHIDLIEDHKNKTKL